MIRNAITALDGALQKRYDRVYTWLMERGVPKRKIRWHLYTLFIVMYCIGFTRTITKSVPGAVIGIALALWIIKIYGTQMQRAHDFDENAEKGPFRSLSDNSVHALSMKLLGFLLLLFPAAHVWAVCSGVEPWHFSYATDFVTAWASISIGYLCGTPPTAPRPKVPKGVQLPIPKVA